MAVDPFQDEFFKTDSVGGFSHALLRETIQNSLDAKARSSQDVKIFISIFRGNGSADNPEYRSYFDGLQEHLKAGDNGLIDRPAWNNSLDFLVIEDFNTTGLEGDPELGTNPVDDNSSENFYYFWRNYGRSGKSGSERGRWGLGKTVFSAVSKINTFFGLTIRESDKRALLLGQSVLKIHTVENKSYMPYGGYGKFRNTLGEQFFPIPVEDPLLIRKFAETFHLKRSVEPGLSIIIPYPYPDISANSLRTGIIRQFFYPIMSGDLSITIRENDATTVLDREDIIPLLTDGILFTNEFDRDSEDINLLKLFHFAKTAIEMRDDQYVRLTPPVDLNAFPIWSDDLFQSVSLAELRKRFDRNEVIGFRIPVKVQRIGHLVGLNWFRVFVQRDGTLRGAENYFVREGIRISGITSFRDRGIRGMVVIDEGELTTLIGDAENPAHTEWQKDSSKFRNKYKHGSKTLDFVKASLREIIRRLMKPAEGVDNEVLGDVFYFDLPQKISPEDTSQKSPDEKKKGEESEEEFEVDVESRVKPVLLSRISGGVRIYKNPKSEKNISSVKIEFAYAVRRGNAFRKYQKPDFDLGEDPIIIQGSGFKIDQAAENLLKADITDQAFEITVTGFDEYRDLVIRFSPSEVSL